VTVPLIVVVANRHRPAAVLDWLDGLEHQVSYTPDHELPAGFTTDIRLAAYNQVGAYRCFRGHQDAIGLASGEPVLVLEDDAVPNVEGWLSIVESASAALAEHEVVSLHGRGFDPAGFERRAGVAGRDLLVPRFWRGPVRVFGSLAYLIRGAAGRRFMAMRYEGVPVDLLLPSRFRFCLVHPSPFDHDRRHPSLIG